MQQESKRLSPTDLEARSRTALHIVYWALAAVTVLGFTGIACAALIAENGTKFTGVKEIISMILPVLGAWIGTVLAFYFSRENYITAAEKNAAVLNHRLLVIPMTDVMIPIEKAGVLITDDSEDKIKLKDRLLVAKFNKHAECPCCAV